MNHCALAICLLLPGYGLAQSFLPDSPILASHERDTSSYTAYHQTIVQAEELIADQHYEAALGLYQQVIGSKNFIFLREYKLATQLALQVGQTQEAFTYLKKGIASGWAMKSIKKNEFLRKLQRFPEWKDVDNQYDSLRGVYLKRIDLENRAVVKKLFATDQRKALGALFRFTSKGQERYAEKRFAPHSAKQLARLNAIIDTYGYPGEKLIGNSYWAAVILSHHNSISKNHTLTDTLYANIRPKLLKAIQLGQMSPHEFAMIETWYSSIKSGQKAYGYLSDVLTKTEQAEADRLRHEIGLCSVETTNRLLDREQQTGLNVYLPLRSAFYARKITVIE